VWWFRRQRAFKIRRFQDVVANPGLGTPVGGNAGKAPGVEPVPEIGRAKARRDSQGSLPKTGASPYLDDKATEL
jgi:hypothetical protein